jgi:hypothetical protein
LLYESSPERMATDLKLLGNLDFSVIPGAQEGARFLQIGLPECLGPAADTSAPAGGFEAGVNTLAQDVAFEFRILRRTAKC